jgi:hypothetical protein
MTVPQSTRTLKTHCPQGHPYSGDNLYIQPGSGSRMCKACRYESAKRYRLNNPESTRATRKKWYERTGKAYYTPERRRAEYLRLTYGLSPLDMAALVLEQGGRCALCKEERILIVDHDHNSGEVRALLCNNCNAGLGMFEDSVQRLSQAIGYLEGF